MSATVLSRSQVKTFGPKQITYYGEPSIMTVEVRYDDECGNGHNTFAITADIRPVDRHRGWEAGGVLHDEVTKHFPELAPFIKWHNCSSDGPMYYIANTVYHAGDRDCHGLQKANTVNCAMARADYQLGNARNCFLRLCRNTLTRKLPRMVMSHGSASGKAKSGN